MLKVLTKGFDPGQGPVLVATQQFDMARGRVDFPMSVLVHLARRRRAAYLCSACNRPILLNNSVSADNGKNPAPVVREGRSKPGPTK